MNSSLHQANHLAFRANLTQAKSGADDDAPHYCVDGGEKVYGGLLDGHETHGRCVVVVVIALCTQNVCQRQQPQQQQQWRCDICFVPLML